MPQRSGLPVMADVARLAGVSYQTVSRVLNDSPHVSATTRARVVAAMTELGYRRNATARALVTRRSGVLGLLTFDTVRHGPISTLYAVEQAADAEGFGVGIAVADRDFTPGDVGAAAARALGRLRDQAVEGVVALAPERDTVLALTEQQLDLPVVLVGGARGGAEEARGRPAVGIDQYGGAQSATRHLLGLGHRTVHHVAGPASWMDAQRRRSGWHDTLVAAGAPVPAPVSGDWTPASGAGAMRALLAADPTLTAVFVANDQMAIGALHALHHAGRAVPGDVALVGFDDLPESAYVRPPLTTVAQDFAEAGRRAVHLLIRSIRHVDGEPEPADTAVATHLVVRSSCGARS